MNLKKLYKLNAFLYHEVLAKWTSAGGVVVNEKGEIALVKPSGEYGGYKWTYPKGGQQGGESLEQTALREVEEESGLIGEIVAPLGKFEGTSSFTYYYLMKLVRDTGHHDWETEEVRFVSPEKAKTMLNSSRDLKVLNKVIPLLKKVIGEHKAVAINRRRFFVKKLLNFLSRDFTKGYTPAQIASFLDADPEKVNYALTYLAESGKIISKDGMFRVATANTLPFHAKEGIINNRYTTTTSKRRRHIMASKKIQKHTEAITKVTADSLRNEAKREIKEGKEVDLFEFLNRPEKYK